MSRTSRNILIFFIILIAVILLSIYPAFVLVKQALQPINSKSREMIEFVVPARTSALTIALRLEEQQIIRHRYLFLGYAYYKKANHRLKAGTYALGPAMTVPEIVETLTLGRVVRVGITVPEGFTFRQIADLIASKGFAERESVVAVADSNQFAYDFLQEAPARENRLEGFLFPDTYLVDRGTGAKQILDLMLRRFSQELTPQLRQRATELNLTIPELVTVASLVEREAKLAKDRPLIAGVIYNRLARGMPLQVDATIQYALGQPKPRLTLDDLKIESPYNTYLHSGLPPGPIASSGTSALQAAANPAHHDYLFYVLNTDGSHIFSKTLAEHNRAKAKIRQLEKRKKAGAKE